MSDPNTRGNVSSAEGVAPIEPHVIPEQRREPSFVDTDGAPVDPVVEAPAEPGAEKPTDPSGTTSEPEAEPDAATAETDPDASEADLDKWRRILESWRTGDKQPLEEALGALPGGAEAAAEPTAVDADAASEPAPDQDDGFEDNRTPEMHRDVVPGTPEADNPPAITYPLDAFGHAAPPRPGELGAAPDGTHDHLDPVDLGEKRDAVAAFGADVDQELERLNGGEGVDPPAVDPVDSTTTEDSGPGRHWHEAIRAPGAVLAADGLAAGKLREAIPVAGRFTLRRALGVLAVAGVVGAALYYAADNLENIRDWTAGRWNQAVDWGIGLFTDRQIHSTIPEGLDQLPSPEQSNPGQVDPPIIETQPALPPELVGKDLSVTAPWTVAEAFHPGGAMTALREYIASLNAAASNTDYSLVWFEGKQHVAFRDKLLGETAQGLFNNSFVKSLQAN